MKIIKLVNGIIEENCYLLINEKNKEGVIIDGGVDLSLIDETVKKEGVTIKAMLLTHFHFDHALVASALKERGIKIYISEQDAPYLNKNSRIAEFYGYNYTPCTPTDVFKDGDVITEAGLDFKVMLTPGHTMGSCCFLIENVMFSGDTLFLETVGRTTFKESQPKLLPASLKRIISLEKDYTVYTGHGENTTIFYEKQYNPYINHDN